jgi:hypothetical protein
MSFFDKLVNTPDYQAQLLGSQQTAPQGIAAPMAAPMMAPSPMSAPMNAPINAPIGMAKGGLTGGLTGVNQNIEQVQIMKVIANYFKNKGLPVEAALKGVQKEIQSGLQLIPFENSVMGFKPLGKGVAQIHFFTVGTMQDLANDMTYFYKYLKDNGITTVYDSVPAPITTQMFQKLGATIEKSDNPKYQFKALI